MRVALEALGCRLNDAELESIELTLKAAGHEIVKAGASNADVVVINSCGVTGAAMRKSRNLARRRLATDPLLLVIMGCAVDLTPIESGLIPDADFGTTHVVQIRRNDKDRAAEIIANAIDALPKPKVSEPLARALGLYHEHTRRFIKIQDGCNNQCSYCSVRIARGSEKSVTQQEVLETIRRVSACGTAEVILTGVQLGAWSEDALRLPDLIDSILRETSIARVRLSSIEPWHLSEALWKQWTKSTRLCPHFHIPIQSGSPEILRAMRRRGDHVAYLEKLDAMRAEIPNLRLSTDIITGFPGESDAHWQESMAFLRRAQLDDVHLFRFSARPGTPAQGFPLQTTSEQRRERLHEAQSLVDAIKRERTQAFAGERFSVLWESASPSNAGTRLWQGYTENYLRVQRHFPELASMRGKVSEIVFGEDRSDFA